MIVHFLLEMSVDDMARDGDERDDSRYSQSRAMSLVIFKCDDAIRSQGEVKSEQGYQL